jgi:hypothetical protein
MMVKVMTVALAVMVMVNDGDDGDGRAERPRAEVPKTARVRRIWVSCLPRVGLICLAGGSPLRKKTQQAFDLQTKLNRDLSLPTGSASR